MSKNSSTAKKRNHKNHGLCQLILMLSVFVFVTAVSVLSVLPRLKAIPPRLSVLPGLCAILFLLSALPGLKAIPLWLSVLPDFNAIPFWLFASLGPECGPPLPVGAAFFFLELGFRRSLHRVFTHGRHGEEMKAKQGGEKEQTCVF